MVNLHISDICIYSNIEDIKQIRTTRSACDGSQAERVEAGIRLLFTNARDLCRHRSLPDTGLQARQVIGVDTIVELISSVTDVSDGGANVSGDVDR